MNPWQCVQGSGDTPTGWRSVIDRIHASLLSVMKQPAIVKFFNDTSRDMKILGPEEFARFKEAEVKGFAQLVQKAQLNLSDN